MAGKWLITFSYDSNFAQPILCNAVISEEPLAWITRKRKDKYTRYVLLFAMKVPKNSKLESDYA